MRIFSVERFKNHQRMIGASDDSIEYSLNAWARECDGKEVKGVSILGTGCMTMVEWTLEIGECSNAIYESIYEVKT
jgi:hypothetical protein